MGSYRVSTRLAAGERLGDNEGSAGEVADGGPGGLALEARGSGDGAISGEHGSRLLRKGEIK